MNGTAMPTTRPISAVQMRQADDRRDRRRRSHGRDDDQVARHCRRTQDGDRGGDQADEQHHPGEAQQARCDTPSRIARSPPSLPAC